MVEFLRSLGFVMIHHIGDGCVMMKGAVFAYVAGPTIRWMTADQLEDMLEVGQ